MCQILIKLEFSRQFFKKYTGIDFRDNPSCGSHIVPCGRKKDERQSGLQTLRTY